MKKFLTVLLSFQLILFSSTLSWAGEGDGETTQDQRSSDQEITQLTTGASTDAGAAFYANQLLLMGTAAVGTSLLLSCATGYELPSIYLFTIGSILHIISEKAISADFADRLNRSVESHDLSQEKLDKLKASGDLQLASVKAMISDQENVLKFAKDKRDVLAWAMGLYWAATASALGEQFIPLNPGGFGGCLPGPRPDEIATAKIIIGFFMTPILGMAHLMTGGNALTGLGTFIVGFIPFVTAVSGSKPAYMNFGLSRGITFGALAGISTWLLVDMQMKVDNIENNITKLNALKDSLPKSEEEDPGIGFDPDSNTASSSSSGNSNSAYSASGTLESTPKTCTSSGESGLSFSSDCSKSLKVKAPKFEGDLNNPFVNDVIQSQTSAVNSAAEGNIGAAKTEMAKIASQAGRFREIAKNAMKKTNEMLKKEGKPTIDFEKEMANRANEFRGIFNKGLSGSGQQLAALDSKAISDAIKKDEQSKPAVNVIAAPAAGNVPAPSNFFKGLENLSNEELKKDPAPTVADSLDKFESSVSDINNNKSASIFDILSNRYVLNYEKIMNRKTSNPSAPLSDSIKAEKDESLKK